MLNRTGGGQILRQVVVYPGGDSYFVVEEAITNIKEAIRGYIATLEQDGLPVPEERFEAMLVAV